MKQPKKLVLFGDKKTEADGELIHWSIKDGKIYFQHFFEKKQLHMDLYFSTQEADSIQSFLSEAIMYLGRGGR